MPRNSPRFPIDLIRNACAEGEPDAIAELASRVEAALRWRNRQTEEGGTAPVVWGGAIPDSEASNYTYRLVKACHLHGHTPPAELVALLQTLLVQDRPPRGTGPRIRTAPDWLARAKLYWDRNPGARPADLARAAAVNRSTVARAIQKGRLAAPFVADKEGH